MTAPVCVIAGVGPGHGAALARRFVRAGHTVALLARTTTYTAKLAEEVGQGRAYACDVGEPDSVERTFRQIREELGDPDVLVHNARAGVWGSVEDVTIEGFESTWRTNAFGSFLVARQVIPAMTRRGSGSIVLIGATASRRGAARMAAIASAKSAQRILAESLARHLWPKGIHVASVVIDGAMDVPWARELVGDKPDSFFIQPADVAETVYWLTQQPRSAWAFELEARPFGETW